MALNVLTYADQYPDLSVTKFIQSPSGFLHIQLENLSQNMITVKEEWREKVFLIIYINQVKRAEYPVKYFNPKLFSKNSSIIHKTNFRALGQLSITVKINPNRMIQETNYLNNELTKEIHEKK